MVQTVGELSDHLREIKEERRSGALTLEAYYKELLTLSKELLDALLDEIDSIDGQEIRKQVPLILLFLEDQIQKFGDRS